MIFEIKGFLDEDRCSSIINDNKSKVKSADIGVYIDDLGIPRKYNLTDRIKVFNSLSIYFPDIRSRAISILSDKLNIPKKFLQQDEKFDFIKYGERGHFLWHKDVTKKNEFYTGVIHLNNNYEGGKLLCRNNLNSEIHELKNDIGTLYLFPSETWHSVTRITSGFRYSLATWFFSSYKSLI